MIVVTLLAVACGAYSYVAPQAKIVRERDTMRRRLSRRSDFHIMDDPAFSLPWVRRLLGDKPVDCVITEDSPVQERLRIESLFPEAILLWSGGGTKLQLYPEFENRDDRPLVR
jgi:hypothetical protein